MKNKFVTPAVHGRMHVRVEKPNGEVRFEYENDNEVLAALKQRLCGAMTLGTFAAMDNLMATGGSVVTDMHGKDGIAVFNTADDNADGTLLACQKTHADNTNRFIISGSNSLFDNNTMDRFVMGFSFNTDEAFDAEYFAHAPTDFAYSDGDTITVNWTVSVT